MTPISDLVDGEIPKKRLCVLCYKCVFSENQGCDKEKVANNEIRNFLKSLEEYIGIWEKDIQLPGEKSSSLFNVFSKPGNDFWEGFGRCKDCDVFIKRFCDVYHQWKYLELQLEWKVKMLIDIMKSANRVPSRVQQLKDMFQETHVDNVTTSANCIINKTKLEIFKKFRHAITRKCSEKISKAMPRIILKRLEVNSDSKEVPLSLCSRLRDQLVHNNSNDVTVCANTVGVAIFLGWSMSLAAVVTLLGTATCFVSRMGYSDSDLNVFEDWDVDGNEEMEEGEHQLFTSRNDLSSRVPVENQVSLRECCGLTFDAGVEKQEVVQHNEDFINVQDHVSLDILNEQEVELSSLDDRASSPMDQDDFHESTVLERNENGSGNVNAISIHHSPIRNNSGSTFEEEHGDAEMVPTEPITYIKEGVIKDEKFATGEEEREEQQMEKLDEDEYTSTSSSDDEIELKVEIKKEFRSSNNQKQQQSFHKRLLQCTICSKILSHCKLRRHMNEQHSASSDNHKRHYYHCKICRKPFKRYSHLRQHKTSKNHKARRKLFLNKQKHLKMKNISTESTVKQSCGNRRKREATSTANVETTEPVIESEGQVCNEESGKLKDKISEAVGTIAEQTVPQENVTMSPVPQKRYSLREKRKKSYREMETVDEEEDSTNDINFQLDNNHDNSVEDKESSSSSESDQDTSNVNNNEISETDTEFETNNQPRKVRQKLNDQVKVKVEKDVETKKEKRKYRNGISHLPYTEENEKFTCKYCGKVFQTVGSFVTHRQNYHKLRNKFICTVDQYRFKTKADLENHQKLHGEFKCNFCNVVKSFAPDLCIHEMEHAFRPEPEPTSGQPQNEALQNFNCPRCSYSCQVQGIYIQHHLKEHIKLAKKPFSCPVCGAGGASKDFLKNHFELQHNTNGLNDSQIWRCDQCSAYFIKSAQLVQHLVKIHSNEGTKCPVCSKIYSGYLKLKYHLQHVHPDYFPNLKFLCNFIGCKRRFATQTELDNHKKTKVHEEDTNAAILFKCSQCNKEFNKQIKLKCHIKRVHVIPSFVCTECGKAFKTKQSLAIHMDYHKPDSWKFSCPTCGKKLATQQKLDEHLRTHTKEKPFVCQVCGEKYAHRHNWKNHVKSKHPERYGEVEHTRNKRDTRKNYLSRKGSRKGDLITAGAKA